MPTKKPSVKAYVSPETKKAIVEMAKSPKTSVSKVAGKILDIAIFNHVTGFDPEMGDPDKLSNQFAKMRKEELK